MKEKPKPSKRIKELEMKLKRLQAEKEILNRAIDLADKQLGTDIRKKYLALLSKVTEDNPPSGQQGEEGQDADADTTDRTVSP